MQVKGNKSHSLSILSRILVYFFLFDPILVHVAQMLFSSVIRLGILPACLHVGGHLPTMHTPPHPRPRKCSRLRVKETETRATSILTLEFPHSNLKADVGLWDVQKSPLPPFVVS